jgi:hypothetical protein
MTITIPTWVLWTLGLGLGIPAAVAILFLAWFGWQAIGALK